MSVLIKDMKMPENCYECDYVGFADLVGFVCPVTINGVYNSERRPNGCPLIEVPPHGDLIDKEVLYNKTAEWEARALAQLDKLHMIPLGEMETKEYIAWRVWSAIYQERTAFKHDVFDAPVVIEAEGEDDGRTEGT